MSFFVIVYCFPPAQIIVNSIQVIFLLYLWESQPHIYFLVFRSNGQVSNSKNSGGRSNHGWSHITVAIEISSISISKPSSEDKNNKHANGALSWYHWSYNFAKYIVRCTISCNWTCLWCVHYKNLLLNDIPPCFTCMKLFIRSRFVLIFLLSNFLTKIWSRSHF